MYSFSDMIAIKVKIKTFLTLEGNGLRFLLFFGVRAYFSFSYLMP